MMRSCNSKALSLLFLALALPLGVLVAHLVPLGQVADEPAHVLKADALLQGEWIGHRVLEPGPDGRPRPHEGLDADRALLAVIVSSLRVLDTTPTRLDPKALARSATVPFGEVHFSELGTIASYFPAFYLPAAGALQLTKTLNFGARAGFLAARMANLLIALSMGAASLLLARRGAGTLFAMLLLPPSVGLMASVNQDGLLIAASALAAALITRIAADLPPLHQPAYLGSVLLIGCICLAKPPYLPMTALLLLPLGRSWRHPHPAWLASRLVTLVIILLLVVLWSWANVRYAAAPIYRAPENAGPLWIGSRPAIFDGTDMMAQLHVLLIRPWRLVWLPVHSLLTHPDVLRQMVDVLGWLNLLLPTWLAALWAAALVLALLSTPLSRHLPEKAVATGAEAILLAVAVFTTVLLIYLSQYLSFTPVGWNWISGPQGRYLIPLLPMISLAITPSSPDTQPVNVVALLPTILASLASIWIIPARVLEFYYFG